MRKGLSSKDARGAIRTLRSGAVTPQAARAITVGTQSLEREFHNRVQELSSIGAEGQCLLMQGDWGCGKTHMRMLFREHLVRNHIPFVEDTVDGRAGSLAHIHRCIPRWLSQLSLGDMEGFRNMLLCGTLDRSQAVNWCRLRKHPYAKNPFAMYLSRALISGWYWGWFMALGHGYHTPDYSYQHPKARDLFFSAVELLSALDKGGLVLILDEVENISRQASIIGRRKFYDTLGRLTANPLILPFLFVTERFYRQLADDWERGKWEGWHKWTRSAREFVERPLWQGIMSPPEVSHSLAKRLVRKIGQVYATGYGTNGKKFPEAEIIALWKKTLTRPPRLLVRMTVHQLDLMRLYDL